MGEASTAAMNPEVFIQELRGLLEAGNYDAVKLLLQPVQEVDIAEAIGGLPARFRPWPFGYCPRTRRSRFTSTSSPRFSRPSWSVCAPVKSWSWWKRCPR